LGSSASASLIPKLALLALFGPVLAAQHFHTSIGVTEKGSPIRAVVAWESLKFEVPKPTVFLIGGLDASSESTILVNEFLRGNLVNQSFVVSAIPNGSPEGTAVDAFPPEGLAYGEGNSEAHYLWRFVAMHAPDLVVEVRGSPGPGSLTNALMAGDAPAGVGTIPVRGFVVNEAEGTAASLRRLLESAIAELGTIGRQSSARAEMRRRLKRDPTTIAQQLESAYGHQLDQVAYIPSLALLGRMRLGDLDGTTRVDDIEQIVAPYLAGKPSLDERVSGSVVSGHLVFADLYERTGKPEYLALARAAADLAFNDDGSMKESMPFHNEMSDSVFMGCAILAHVGRLTGEARYFEMALTHLRFMQNLDLREDGLYRHSPLDEAAWGRGNGFPALGLVLALSDWPQDRPGRNELIAAFQAHMAALVRHQDETGTWHEVIDRTESYREFTATAMINFAITRGLRRGWLSRADFESVADRAWYALKTRIAPDASLVDVCRGTGRQPSLRAYYDREAILGRDDRGGAMALLSATERAYWQRER